MPKIRLSDHFTYSRLLRFTMPSMLMVITTSVYGMVDGLLVSNYCGTTAFAALNLAWPFIAVLGAVGYMFGTGGSALVAKTLGRGHHRHARSIFSMLTAATIIAGTVLGALGFISVDEVVRVLGADDEMAPLCDVYGRILLAALPFYMLQMFYQSFLITAERPKMGMWVTIGAGLLNVVLDILFICCFGWGLEGAAWATAASQVAGGIVPLAYFIAKRRSSMTLRLGELKFEVRALWQSSLNGLSEFVMSISLSVVSMLYMYQLMRHAGENGVAAYGIMMYFAYTFVSIFIGYGIGTAPVISFHYGADDTTELKSLLRKSMVIIAITGIAITAISQIFARPLSAIFVGYDPELLDMTVHAFRIYSLMFLVTGFNMFISAFFTALNNGPISALISLLRTLGFEGGCVMLLPALIGIEGIWWSVFISESITLLIALAILRHLSPRYGY